MVEGVKMPCPYGCSNGKRMVWHRVREEFHGTRCMCTYKDKEALPIPLVLQPEKSGCMLAAVATVVGHTYRYVRQLVDLSQDFTTEGTFTHVIQEVLNELGYSYQVYTKYHSRLGYSIRPETAWPLKPFAVPTICQVRNLTISGKHAVVQIPDGRVLDPWWGVVQGLHRYEEVFEMMPVYKVPTPTPAPVVVPPPPAKKARRSRP